VILWFALYAMSAAGVVLASSGVVVDLEVGVVDLESGSESARA
jgi:hypothetical protein